MNNSRLFSRYKISSSSYNSCEGTACLPIVSEVTAKLLDFPANALVSIYRIRSIRRRSQIVTALPEVLNEIVAAPPEVLNEIVTALE